MDERAEINYLRIQYQELFHHAEAMSDELEQTYFESLLAGTPITGIRALLDNYKKFTGATYANSKSGRPTTCKTA